MSAEIIQCSTFIIFNILLKLKEEKDYEFQLTVHSNDYGIAKVVNGHSVLDLENLHKGQPMNVFGEDKLYPRKICVKNS